MLPWAWKTTAKRKSTSTQTFPWAQRTTAKRKSNLNSAVPLGQVSICPDPTQYQKEKKPVTNCLWTALFHASLASLGYDCISSCRYFSCAPCLSRCWFDSPHPKESALTKVHVPHRTTVPLVYHSVGSILHIPNDLSTSTRSPSLTQATQVVHQYISVGSVYQGVGSIPHIPKDLSILTKVQVPPGYDNKDCLTARGR